MTCLAFSRSPSGLLQVQSYAPFLDDENSTIRSSQVLQFMFRFDDLDTIRPDAYVFHPCLRFHTTASSCIKSAEFNSCVCFDDETAISSSQSVEFNVFVLMTRLPLCFVACTCPSIHVSVSLTRLPSGSMAKRRAESTQMYPFRRRPSRPVA
ncbi:hypothetical protein AVEN_145160-1 [Araneus ventricosus]|uniref:Uncharacterized protein n=1 Tax=Araneus ventricosus TaxID=182803 RepID=A0A4Y2R921_ARAVE|nr:hypothetical protein AVEN_145160-1 [Araneus ventricosus]